MNSELRPGHGFVGSLENGDPQKLKKFYFFLLRGAQCPFPSSNLGSHDQQTNGTFLLVKQFQNCHFIVSLVVR